MKQEQSVAIEIVAKMILQRYQQDRERVSFPPGDPSLIRKALGQYDFKEQKPLADAVLEVGALLERWNLDTCHPRYMGLFNGPAHFSSVIADAMVAAFNPQLSSWSHGAVANEIEAHVIQFFLQLFGLEGSESTGHFTSGGSESNTTGLLCALSHTFSEFHESGIVGLPKRPVIYVSEYAHHSIQKAACSIGLGVKSIRLVSTDSQQRMNLDDLKKQIEEDFQGTTTLPVCVVGTAGTTSGGAIDPLDEISQICRNHGLWFHTDAAWGGAALFSDRLKPFLKGIENADSITFDAHKWMATSMGAGIFLGRRKKVLEDIFKVSAKYMPALLPGTVDPHKTSLQWSRRFIGLKVFLALAEKGLPGFKAQIEQQTEVANVLRAELLSHGWRVVNSTPLPVVCFTHPLIRSGAHPIQNVLKKLYNDQKFWISTTEIGGEGVFRVSITHPETTQEDVRGLVANLEENLL